MLSSLDAIGIFDSGMGGLTVLKALQQHLPYENFIYLGDTARLPYGTKSADTVIQYALQAANLIRQHPIKLLVIACNTASSVALQALQAELSPIPVIGVVTPGAKACLEVSKSKRIGILATESTVKFNAYGQIFNKLEPEALIYQWPCSLLVPLVEEGWTSGKLVEQIIMKLLNTCLNEMTQFKIDTILLGCTHFPVLREAIQTVLGPNINLVDSAKTTALAVQEELKARGLLRGSAESGQLRLMATDKLTRFSEVAAVFMGQHFQSNVEWISL